MEAGQKIDLYAARLGDPKLGEILRSMRKEHLPQRRLY